MTKKQVCIRVILIGYILCSLPIVVVFLKSEYVRFIAIQMVANWNGKLNGLSEAYIGDSITAAGRNWGAPFQAINLAGNEDTLFGR